MTEQLFPDEVVNGLFDGTLPAADVPAPLQGVADVVRAARRVGTEDELSGIAALMQRFSAEVAVVNEVAPVPTPRSSPMIATRITRRAAAIVAITVLAAGTAAAAAGGGLDSFTASDDVELVEEETAPIADPTTTEANVTTTSEEIVEVEEEVVALDVEAPLIDESTTTVHDPETADHFGKCTAWTNGAPKKITNPAFAELQTAADEGAVSVDEYCEATLAAKAAEKAAEKADDADEDESDEDESDEDDADDADDDEDEDDEDDEDDTATKGKKGGNNGADRGKGRGKNG